ncbi:hypothetical protein V6N12_045133 [Hibiscus sabdariffa]|uniref:RNase H type-1 domain-containing protein n=1 Tax=Hibiscus sabdariffa TaxID=183260 RepID=A0ABR2G2H2_9ROSI
MKIGYQLLVDIESLWASVLRTKYGVADTLPLCLKNGSCSRLWNGLNDIWEDIWYDIWLGSHGRLVSECTISFSPRPVAVSDMVIAAGGWDWNRVRDECSLCNGGPGSVPLFFSLPFDEWFDANVNKRLSGGDGGVDWGVRFSIYCWLLWKSCCSRMLDVDYEEQGSILERRNRLVVECGAAFRAQQQRLPREMSSILHWEGPRCGWIKRNVDAGVNPSDGSAAVGGVFRDESGTWLSGFSLRIGRCSVLLAELWAIRDGLRHAWDLGFRYIELETDNKEVANLCNGLSETLAKSILVEGIHELRQREWQTCISYVCRERNAVADKLASLGRYQSLEGLMFVIPPDVVVELVGTEQCRW